MARFQIVSVHGVSLALSVLIFAQIGCVAAEADHSIVQRAAAFGGNEVAIKLQGDFSAEESKIAAWVLSLDESVLAQRKSKLEVATDGKSARMRIVLPDVARRVALRLDTTISNQQATCQLQVYPADYGKTLAEARALKNRAIALFGTGEFPEQLKECGVKVEEYSTALGLSAFKEGVLIVSPAESGGNWDLAARLDARVRAGKTVVVFVPKALKLPGFSEPIDSQQAKASIQSVRLGSLTDSAPFNGFDAGSVLRIPSDTSFVPLLSAGNEKAPRAIVSEFATGKGRWIFVAFDPVARAQREPAALVLLWGILDFAIAQQKSTKE